MNLYSIKVSAGPDKVEAIIVQSIQLNVNMLLMSRRVYSLVTCSRNNALQVVVKQGRCSNASLKY